MNAPVMKLEGWNLKTTLRNLEVKENMDDKLRERITTYLQHQQQTAALFLKRLIQIPSLSGEEQEIMELLDEAFHNLGNVRKVFLTNDMKSDPEYTHRDYEIDHSGHYNLAIEKPGHGKGRSIILQAHTDTVPVSDDYTEAFSGKEQDGYLLGRGACDDKGSVATLYMVMKCLRDLEIELQGDIQTQLVIEEESGGNGALAFLLDGCQADGVIVLEATDLHIHPSNRGALWFRVQVEGKSVHMGKITEGVNAIEKGMLVIQEFRKYEQMLIQDSRGYPGFEKYQQPVQVNIGTIYGGEYPSTVAGHVTIEGGVGFLPNKNLTIIKKELNGAIRRIDDSWIQDHYVLDYPKLHNEAFECAFDHPLVTTLKNSCQRIGLTPDVCGLDVSCDARLYAIKGKMPTVVFGPGKIEDAHSQHEKIKVDDILLAAEAITLFLIEWCSLRQ
jgi:acetylornithine deacetylase